MAHRGLALLELHELLDGLVVTSNRAAQVGAHFALPVRAHLSERRNQMHLVKAYTDWGLEVHYVTLTAKTSKKR